MLVHEERKVEEEQRGREAKLLRDEWVIIKWFGQIEFNSKCFSFHCSYLYPRICIPRDKKISSSGRQLASPRDPPRTPRARNSGDEAIVRRYRGSENHCGGKIIARNSNVNARGRQWPPRVNVVTLLAAFSAERVQLTILWFDANVACIKRWGIEPSTFVLLHYEYTS